MSAAWTAKGLAVFDEVRGVATPVARVMPGPNAERNARLIAAAPELEDQIFDVLRLAYCLFLQNPKAAASLDEAEQRRLALLSTHSYTPDEIGRALRLLSRISGSTPPRTVPRDEQGGAA